MKSLRTNLWSIILKIAHNKVRRGKGGGGYCTFLYTIAYLMGVMVNFFKKGHKYDMIYI